MTFKIIQNLLPWIIASISVFSALFIIDDPNEDEKHLANSVMALSGVAASIAAFFLLQTPANYFVSMIFFASAFAVFITKDKVNGMAILSVALSASIPWMTNNMVMSVFALSMAGFLIGITLDKNQQSNYLKISAIVSMIAMLGAVIQGNFGFLFIGTALVWFAFLYPFAGNMENKSKQYLILRVIILPLGILSFLNLLMILKIIAVFTLITTAATALRKDKSNTLYYLSSASVAILILTYDKNPLWALTHMLAIIGAIISTYNNKIFSFTKKICLLSLAGLPLLGGFWPRWSIITNLTEKHEFLIPIIIGINSIVFISTIIFSKDTNTITSDKHKPTILDTAILTTCVTLIILIGVSN